MTLCHEVPARRIIGDYRAKTGRIIAAGFLREQIMNHVVISYSNNKFPSYSY